MNLYYPFALKIRKTIQSSCKHYLENSVQNMDIFLHLQYTCLSICIPSMQVLYNVISAVIYTK